MIKNKVLKTRQDFNLLSDEEKYTLYTEVHYQRERLHRIASQLYIFRCESTFAEVASKDLVEYENGE